MCEQFFLSPHDCVLKLRWCNWVYQVVDIFHLTDPHRHKQFQHISIQILVSDLVYLFFLPVWDDEHGPLTFLFFRGGCLEHQPRGSTSGYCFQKFLGPDAPSTLDLPEFLGNKKWCQTLWQGVITWFVVDVDNYIVWTLNSLSLFPWVIWIEITINDHKWRFPKIGLPPVIHL